MSKLFDKLVDCTKDIERALAFTRKQKREPCYSKATSPGGFDRNTYDCAPPPASGQISKKMLCEKEALPIFRRRVELLELLRRHQVIIISGETGSGKTTQVPQYILKNANECQTPCKIIVTQPRRIAAVSLATRVAEERGEQVGKTVAYQIRLESTVTSTTKLIYTTSGSFLRTIIQECCTTFRCITHLIIDEIHERDRDTDFTLITVKEQLSLNPNLRVILMSATMDVALLSTYFGDCPVMTVPGQGYNVKVFTLEEILYHSGYRSVGMKPVLESWRHLQEQRELLERELSSQKNVTLNLPETSVSHLTSKTLDCVDFIQKDNIYWTLEQCCNENYELLGKKREPPNIDTVCGHLDQLLLERAVANTSQQQQKQQQPADLKEQAILLEAYESQFNIPSDVDHNLILWLLGWLYKKQEFGAVMVFLPGYSDILLQAELIQKKFPASTYQLFILHGSMNPENQSEALRVCNNRKIILSTNIGQTSITIPDLVYIIDSGKVKMKLYDSQTESSQLQLCWISQADAEQRSGRAGRTQNGVCYRLYSRDQYRAMHRFGTPEFMRMSLVDVCLYAKTLQKHLKVQDYLGRALNPPARTSVDNAIKKLQILEIINEDTDQSVTELGKCLVELPLEVQQGKCLLYSIFLCCYSAVLTIVAFHSVKTPFILPPDRLVQSEALTKRKIFAENSFSDHIGILNLYASYIEVRHERSKAKEFCEKNFLSQTSLDLFIDTRRQIGETVERHFTLGPHNDEYKNDLNMVRLALAAGLYPNLVYIDRKRKRILTSSSNDVCIERNSSIIPLGMTRLKQALNDLPHDWLLYYEKSQVGKTHLINMNTLVSPLIVVLQCGKNCKVHAYSREATVGCGEVSEDDSEYDWSESLHARMGEINGNEDESSKNSSLVKIQNRIWIDNAFYFQCTQQEANSIILFRKLYAEQFQLFLHQKQLTDNIKFTSQLLKMLLNGQ